MPRRPRVLLSEYPLHIVQRGINREPCFFAEEDYHCYLHWLEEAAQPKGSKTFSDAPISQADIDSGKLVLVKRAAGNVAKAKKRVTLYLDAAVVERFKEQAGERGYQTLINETLKSFFQQADMEETLRSVIREELGKEAA